MQAPERLGKYLIRRELGRGAMGVVYEGYDPLIERAVAIKVLRLDEANTQLDTELRLRFRREAQAAGRLSHPNIVSVYEYGEEAGSHSAFIAMELVEGRDLKSLFDDGARFPLPEAGRIMGDLLGALQHAHERGVVHRDIKPANIILLSDGSVKVADFGIAKLDTSELTQLGSVLGTVSHMSPEQLTGEAIDRRSDLFSCGVILYQLLTGERAFTGSPATVMHRVLHDQPAAPSTLVAALPRSLDAVVRKAMAKAPAERYATADAFAAALRTAMAGTAVGAADADTTIVLPRPSAAPPAGSRTPVVAGIGALLLLAAAAGAYVLLKAPAAPTPTAASDVPAAAAVAAAPASAVPSAPEPALAVLPAPAPAPAPVVAVASGPSADEIEQEAWDDALKINTAAAFEAYLKGYPKGRYSARARVRLAALAPKPAPAMPPVASPAPPAPTPATTLAKAPSPTPPAPIPPSPSAAQKTLPPPPAASTTASAKPTVTGPGPVAAPRPDAATSSADRTKRPSSSPAPAPAPTPGRVATGTECVDEAKRGNVRCQVVLGGMYRSGNGVARDPVEAARWYRKAAEQGNDVAQYELGTMYDGGLGVPKNPVEAVGWYRKAADQGLARAQNRVGIAYEGGTLGSANLVLAGDWYRKAADQGYAPAQTNLGRFYLQGRGVFKDTAKAGELLQKAVDQGDPNAMVLLAGMYRRGEGKPQDSARAARLYRDALAIPGLTARHRELAEAALAAKS